MEACRLSDVRVANVKLMEVSRHPMPNSYSFFANLRPIFFPSSPNFRFTRCFCAAATATTISPSPIDSSSTIHQVEQKQEKETIFFQNTRPLLLKKKKKDAQLRSKDSLAQMKQNWLASLNNNPLNLDANVSLSPGNAQWVIGIDPDVSGALALLKPLHANSGVSAQVFDSPHVKVLIGNRTRRRLDTKAISQLLQSFDAPIGTIAYLEQSLPYPGDGKQGWWSGGFNYGIWIGVLVALGFSVVPVPSLLWKNQFELSGNGTSKDDSREAARMLFPSISSQLTRKKDHGRAEALLIAAYGKGLKMGSYPSLVSGDLMPSNLGC